MDKHAIVLRLKKRISQRHLDYILARKRRPLSRVGATWKHVAFLVPAGAVYSRLRFETPLRLVPMTWPVLPQRRFAENDLANRLMRYFRESVKSTVCCAKNRSW